MLQRKSAATSCQNVVATTTKRPLRIHGTPQFDANRVGLLALLMQPALAKVGAMLEKVQPGLQKAEIEFNKLWTKAEPFHPDLMLPAFIGKTDSPPCLCRWAMTHSKCLHVRSALPLFRSAW